MNNIEFSVTNVKEIQTEEKGQANKILAYVNGDIKVNSEIISKINGIKLIYSRFYKKFIIDSPQNKSTNGSYYEIYSLTPQIKKIVEEAILKVYNARKSVQELQNSQN